MPKSLFPPPPPPPNVSKTEGCIPDVEPQVGQTVLMRVAQDPKLVGSPVIEVGLLVAAVREGRFVSGYILVPPIAANVNGHLTLLGQLTPVINCDYHPDGKANHWFRRDESTQAPRVALTAQG